MVFLPRSFKKGYIAFQGTGHIFMDTHGSTVVLFAQIINCLIQIRQDAIRYYCTAITR